MRFESNSAILVYSIKLVTIINQNIHLLSRGYIRLLERLPYRSSSCFFLYILVLEPTFSVLSVVFIWVRIMLDYFFSLKYSLGNINFIVQSSSQQHRLFNHFTIADSHKQETTEENFRNTTSRICGIETGGQAPLRSPLLHWSAATS